MRTYDCFTLVSRSLLFLPIFQSRIATYFERQRLTLQCIAASSVDRYYFCQGTSLCCQVCTSSTTLHTRTPSPDTATQWPTVLVPPLFCQPSWPRKRKTYQTVQGCPACPSTREDTDFFFFVHIQQYLLSWIVVYYKTVTVQNSLVIHFNFSFFFFI